MTRSPGKSTVAVILDDELRERLEQAAADNERSVGGEIRVALRAHLGADSEEQQEESPR